MVDPQLCPNCGGLTLTRDDTGWSCKDPDCLLFLVVMYRENTLHLPHILLKGDDDDSK